MARAKRDDAPPYRIKIEPEWWIKARVRAWHRASGDLICDATMWGIDVRRRAEMLARACIVADQKRRRARARSTRTTSPIRYTREG